MPAFGKIEEEIEEEQEIIEDVGESEEEQFAREEKERIARENPPELQQIHIYAEVLLKKKDKLKKDILKYQSNMEDPGHSDMYKQRNERLKKESLDKCVKIETELQKYTTEVNAMNLTGSYSIECLSYLKNIDTDIKNLHNMSSLEDYNLLSANYLVGTSNHTAEDDDDD